MATQFYRVGDYVFNRDFVGYVENHGDGGLLVHMAIPKGGIAEGVPHPAGTYPIVTDRCKITLGKADGNLFLAWLQAS